MPTELTKLRGYTSRTFDNGDGSRTAEIHTGHIHYKDYQGDFQPVNFTLEDKGTYWQMVKANHKLYIAKDFDAPQLLRYDNKYEGANHTLYFEPHSLQWVHKTTHDRVLIKAAQSVTGTIITSITGYSVVYENAFGNNVDFVIEGRRHGFRKYVRFNTKPTLSPPSADYIPVLLMKYEGTGLTVKAKDSVLNWDNDSYYESEEGFELSEVNPQLKTFIGKSYIEDADEKRQKVKLFWERRNTVLWQAKVLPKDFLNNATYPVTADAPFYAIEAGDGAVLVEDTGENWNTVHDRATGTGAGAAGPKSNIIVKDDTSGTGGVNIFRCFVPFDTSGLPDAATITATTLGIYVDFASAGDDDAEAYIAVVETFQAATNALVVGDYEDCGSENGVGGEAKNPNIEEGSDQITISGISAPEWVTFTFNATGRSWVSKTGDTKIGLREGHDLDETKPIAVDTTNRIRFLAAETADTTSDPVLTVTYTLPTAVYRRRRAG